MAKREAITSLTWTNESVKLSALKPWTENPRQSTRKQAAALLKSWERFGQVQTIAIDPDNNVLDGHQRLSALLTIHGNGFEVDARRSSRALTDAERRELVVTLHAGAVGSWDWDALSGWNAPDLMEWGFDAATLTDWKRDVGALGNLIESEKPEPADAEPQTDRAEELREKWQTERGQLWRIGNHRLLCGDSTVAEDVERVMGGEKAKLGMTSPPYWVGKEYEQEKTWGEVQGFITRAVTAWAPALSHRIVINTGTPQAAHLTGERAHIRLLLDDWIREFAQNGFLMRYTRIWVKSGGLVHTKPEADCVDQHWEFVATFYRPETYEGQRRLGEPWATNGIWDDIPGVPQTDHSAPYHIELPARNIRLYSDEGDLVLDPFGGSGTTMVACENLGRKCRMIDVTPGYVAVTLERMATAFPGIEIALVEGD